MSCRISEIIDDILKFRNERDWKQFHNPKDLAISLSIEAGELLECFQWKTIDEVENLIRSKEKVGIEEEIADIAIYLLLLCNDINVDIEEAILSKLKKNNEKYPVEKSKGVSTKYNKL